MKLRTTLLLFHLSFALVCPLLFDKEVRLVDGYYTEIPVAVRHVEFIGTVDNGTLDCFIPGFSQFRWEVINKASVGPYTESTSLLLDEKIKEHQSTLKIGKGGFSMATEMLVVSCEALLNGRPKFQIIWVVTRLHSPLGYPTDPKICTFNRDRYYSETCDHFKWVFNTDCSSGDGRDYRGDAYITTNNPPESCQYWFQNSPNSGSDSNKVDLNKEHRYCRNPTNEHSPWCITTSTSLKKQFCRVQQCSECMYGNGDGNFDLYDYVHPESKWRRKFPEYNGRILETVKEDDNGRPRLCMSGKGWETNLCRPKKGKSTPHCLIAKNKADEPNIKDKGDSRLELVECRIPQCTVRQVWFLFFSLTGKPYLKESNAEAVEITVVHGRHLYFFFGTFGIHLADGLSVSSEDPRLAKFAKQFIVKCRVPPDKLSTITIYYIDKRMSGKYFLQYTFAEANPMIQQSTYKGNLRLDVREPMSLSLSPSVLELCKGQSGSLRIQVSGGFKVHEDSLKWKYGDSRNNINQDISVENPSFELSSDFKKVTIKALQRDTWVKVEGKSMSGKSTSTGLFKVKAQPHIITKSPSQVFALPGDVVSLSLEIERGLKTTWTYEAQIIPEVPDDPDMAFERNLNDNIISETLVFSSLDWRHYGTYVVDTEKDGCRETITFNIQYDKEREINEERNSNSSSVDQENEDDEQPIVKKSGNCEVQQLKLVKHDERNYATNWTIEVPCYSNEEEGVVISDHAVQELSACSVITGYSFTTRTQRVYKLLISTNETKEMEEYNGDVNMKTDYIESNNEEAWVYHYYFSEPVSARLVQFTADQVEDSNCLYGLTLSGCTLAKSRCKPASFTPDDIPCGDKKSSLLNKEEVKKLASCSLITSYQFASNVSKNHRLMFSGTNSMLLMEYDGNMQVESEYSEGEWLYFNSLDEPVAARYVQFVPTDHEEIDGPLKTNKLQITGCRLDKHWCTLDWYKFSEIGLKCDEDQLTPIYSEHPVLDLPSCSLISNYQFIGKSTKQHAMLVSGNNPALMRSFHQGLKIQAFYYKNDEWVFVCSFAAPVVARYVQFVCDAKGNMTCFERLTVHGCPIEESWCEDQSFETKIEEYEIRSSFFHSSLGKTLLKFTITSIFTPIWMFIAGKYNLYCRLAKSLMRFLKKLKKTSAPKKTRNKDE